MARSIARDRWTRAATLAVGALLVAAGCGGAASVASPSLVATGAPSLAAATPTAAPTPSPSPADVSATFLTTLTSPTFSASARISGTMGVGQVEGTITGEGAFDGDDSKLDMTIDLDVFKQVTSQVQVAAQKWSRKEPGPWLEVPASATGSSDGSIGEILKSLVKVTDLGVVTKNGASLHHLQFAGGGNVSGALLGLDPAATNDAKFSVDFYATDEGVPAIMSISGTWTQVNAGVDVPATMSFDITFDDVGTPQTITPPTDVWVVYSSKAMGYSMAHPADWTVTSAKNEDTYAIDGQGYVYVATQSYKGSTATFAADLKASYKKPFKGDPTSEKPTGLGGVPAVRLIYQFTNDKDQDVTVVDDVASRDGTGWEVYLATAGGQEDIDIFDTFVATFTFAE